MAIPFLPSARRTPLPRADSLPTHGLSPAEVAHYLRIGPDRVRILIRTGKLGAINVGSNGRPRFVVLPVHLAAFVEANAAVPPARPRRRPKLKRSEFTDFFPGD